MARWPLLFAALLLAGCSSPSPTETQAPVDTAGDGDPDGGDEAVTSMPTEQPADWTAVYWGHDIGAGIMPAPGSCSFVGISTTSSSFSLKEMADLSIALTWNVTAPVLLNLVVVPPEGPFYASDGLPMSQVDRTIRYAEPEAMAGTWDAYVCTQGPAVADWAITVTVDYPDSAN